MLLLFVHREEKMIRIINFIHISLFLTVLQSALQKKKHMSTEEVKIELNE